MCWCVYTVSSALLTHHVLVPGGPRCCQRPHTPNLGVAGCRGEGSGALGGQQRSQSASECQLPAAVCAERTVWRKSDVVPHPSACSSLCTTEARASTQLTPHRTLLSAPGVIYSQNYIAFGGKMGMLPEQAL